jgi:hypothetical protein
MRDIAMKKRYVVTATWPDGSTEQLEADADSASAASRDAKTVLQHDYEPGWKVTAVDGPMVGFY